jgi:predicted RNA-binding protein with PIN domain
VRLHNRSTALPAPIGNWACDAASILVVDGNNVIGAVADGWWRDRPAAVRRLLGRLQCLGEPATLVLDVAQPDLSEGDHDGITVRYATRRGRDAADDLIREIVSEAPDAMVVTSDRALRRDVEAAGATVIGSGRFLDLLDSAGC